MESKPIISHNKIMLFLLLLLLNQVYNVEKNEITISINYTNNHRIINSAYQNKISQVVVN